MMSRLGSSMDVNTAREIILRDTELEVSFQGFCNIVKAAGERSSKKVSSTNPPPVPPPPKPSAGGASFNAIVLEKYKNNHSKDAGAGT